MSSPLDDMIASLLRLAEMPDEAAKLAAPIVEKVAKAQAADGLAPDGEAWTPKKDGGAPLKNAAKAISVEAIGNVVRVKLAGVEVLHNFGTHRLPKREIIPTRSNEIPPAYAAAIKAGADAAFDKLVRGA